MCIYTHMHINPDAHYKTRCYTNSSRGNKVGLLQQITKNKSSHLQWLWSFLYVHKEWIVTKKKRNSVSESGKMGETSLIQWECSNVLYHFTYFFLSCWFDFKFSAIKFSLTQMTHSKLNKMTTTKALFSGRCQKSQNPWPDSELPCANQYSFNVWNKTEKKKKKTFLKHLNVAIHSRNGCHFFLWAPYWRVLLSAVFLLPVGWMASC